MIHEKKMCGNNFSGRFKRFQDISGEKKKKKKKKTLPSEFPRQAFYIRAARHGSGIGKIRKHPHRTFSIYERIC
jgi:hypothetical protein